MYTDGSFIPLHSLTAKIRKQRGKVRGFRGRAFFIPMESHFHTAIKRTDSNCTIENVLLRSALQRTRDVRVHDFDR